jgi:hypothetical protein
VRTRPVQAVGQPESRIDTESPCNVHRHR